MFNADGSKSGGEIIVLRTAGWAEFGASVAALAGGGYVVVWQEGPATAARRVYGQSTTPRTGGRNDHRHSRGRRRLLSAAGRGAFRRRLRRQLALDRLRPGSQFPFRTARGRAFDPDGQPRGSVISLDVSGEDNANLIAPVALAANAGGGFIAAWNVPGSNIDAMIYAPGDGGVGTIEVTATTVYEALAEGRETRNPLERRSCQLPGGLHGGGRQRRRVRHRRRQADRRRRQQDRLRGGLVAERHRPGDRRQRIDQPSDDPDRGRGFALRPRLRAGRAAQRQHGDRRRSEFLDRDRARRRRLPPHLARHRDQ